MELLLLSTTTKKVPPRMRPMPVHDKKFRRSLLMKIASTTVKMTCKAANGTMVTTKEMYNVVPLCQVPLQYWNPARGRESKCHTCV